VTTLPTVHKMDPACYHHSYIGFFHFLVILNDISFFGYIQCTLKAVFNMLYRIPISFSNFLAVLIAIKYLLHIKSTMKYPGGKNEISIESARYPYCEELS